MAARERPSVHLAVRNVYRALQDAVELRRPVCASSGRCCRFDEYGHRLFVTTMELATFLRDLAGLQRAWEEVPPAGCPFQVGDRCTVHTIRPFGCRVFFCDETASAWQQEQYARFHGEFKRLHDELGVPYFYVEWRVALAAVGRE